jgi:hypothetical protein
MIFLCIFHNVYQKQEIVEPYAKDEADCMQETKTTKSLYTLSVRMKN